MCLPLILSLRFHRIYTTIKLHSQFSSGPNAFRRCGKLGAGPIFARSSKEIHSGFLQGVFMSRMNESMGQGQAGSSTGQLKDTAQQVGQNIREMGSQVRDVAKEQYDNLRNQASEYYDQGREMVNEYQ